MIAESRSPHETLIQVEGVSKKFCRSLKHSLWYGLLDIASSFAGPVGPRELRPHEFWALDDVSFQLRRGECLGLVGPNGSGKSTLLKLVNGLIRPDRGKLTIRGRVGALIELGAGFNPILTGRENIYNNAAVLGMSRHEVDQKLDSIIDFADIGDFIETPVQAYSSGMKVRLGFAVAVHLEPDVLIIDEVLAVGDAGFRSKCYNAIAELAERTAIIFVSHAMSSVSRLANEVLVLDNGKTRFQGSTSEGVLEYFNLFATPGEGARSGNGKARIDEIEFLNGHDETTTKFQYGETFTTRLSVTAHEDIEFLCVDLVFSGMGQQVVAECNNVFAQHPIRLARGQTLSITMTIEELTLNTGCYQLSALLLSRDMMEHYDWRRDFVTIEVLAPQVGVGGQQFRAKWEIHE